MSYLTLEVDIDHGKVVPKEPDKMPESGRGLLTILQPGSSVAPEPRVGAFPVAGLHPTKRTDPRPVGLAKGEFVVPDGFNAPLLEEDLRAFEGK